MDRKFKETNLFKLLIIIIISWIILAIIFGLTDLEISKTLLNRNSVLANFAKNYGEGPGYGIIGVAVAIVIGSFQEDLKKQKFGAFVILIIGLIFFITALILNSVWFIAFGGGIAIIMLIFLVISYNKDWRAYRNLAIVILLLAIINPLIFVQLSKIFWGRVRFNDLNSCFSNYTPWYIPNGPNFTDLYRNSSFPSGHTAMAWMFLPLLIVVKDRKITDPIRIAVTLLVISWGLFIATSRIITGDHYASDVLFSTGMALVMTILLYIKFFYDNN